MNSHPLTSKRPAGHPVLLIAGILCMSMALRAPITGVPPLTGMIREQLGLSATAAGMLITLPLLAFAVVSLFAAGLARRHGLERSLFAAMLLVAAGIVVRTLGPAWSLFLGTVVIGAGIAIGNVLLPSLLKRDFPQQVAGLTSAYVLTMSLAAGLASAIAIPLAGLSDATWRFSSGCLLVVPVLSALLWLPQLANHTAPAASTAHAPHGPRLWRSALAWQVTLFLGINSFVFYVGVSWLPAILRDAGYTAERAGALHGLLQLMSAEGPARRGVLLGRGLVCRVCRPDRRAWLGDAVDRPDGPGHGRRHHPRPCIRGPARQPCAAGSGAVGHGAMRGLSVRGKRPCAGGHAA
jgi:CP family cyanate transporter-like MFS transporter